MALADLSFKLFTDAGLTSPFSGILQLTHNTNLSDNPQDFHLYFGSADDTRKLQANSNPGVDTIYLTPTDNLHDWTANTVYALGDTLEPTSPNGKVYKCTTAGTSDMTTEPTWPTVTIGSTVVDNSVVWTLLGPKHAPTEIKLASSSGALPGATAGAAFSLGTEVDGGTSNKLDVYIRITNAVTNVRNDTGHAEISVNINTVIETAI